MRIFVTRGAVLRREFWEVITALKALFALSETLFGWGVTLRTLHLQMFPFEFKICLIVIKRLAGTEGLGAVAR